MLHEAPEGWSKSSLSSLLDGCAWQWWLVKRAGMSDPGTPATVRGTALHAAVEQHERQRIMMARDGYPGPLPEVEQMVLTAQASFWAEAETLPDETWGRHQLRPEQVAAQVDRLVRNWYDQPAEGLDGLSLRGRLLSMRPVAAEQWFRVRLQPGALRPLHGFIDAVLWDEAAGTWVLVDHKTASNFSRWDGVAGHEREAAVYVAGALLARGVPVAEHPSVRMEWHVVRPTDPARGGPVARAVWWDLDLEQALGIAQESIGQAEQMLAEGRFPTNPSWNLCSARWCPFHSGCQETGELHPSTMVPIGVNPELPLVWP